jgi:hypothetical protein
MKAAIVLVVIGGVGTGVVPALGSTLGPADFDKESAGVTGSLAIGAISRAGEPSRCGASLAGPSRERTAKPCSWPCSGMETSSMS